jgi:hypothetical protein
MVEYVKEPHTAIFSGPTCCGKTQRLLDLIEKEYKDHFENIIILCSTLRWNTTYLERPWVWKDLYVFCIEPKGRLFDWIKKLSLLLSNQETLFIIDDMISDETLDKKRTPLLELAIIGRHRRHYLWLLTQSYTAIPKNLRRQKKMLFLWYPNERSDLKIADEETNIIKDLDLVREELQNAEHVCLYIRLKYPRGYKILN